jgi:hypothetical protein
MRRFHIEATYCAAAGDVARWSRTFVAHDILDAQAKAHRALAARHRGATKIDMRITAHGGPTPSTRMSAPTVAQLPRHEMQLRIGIGLLDEVRLRTFAADRMSRCGYDNDPATHIDEPLGDLLFEALIGSNPDPVSPTDMGIEIISWTGHPQC